MAWTTEITVKNESPYPYTFKIKKGQVFENKKIGTGLQNVAAADDYEFKILPGTTRTVQIEVLCINEHLKSPQGALNLTNFQISGTFYNQRSLWDIMRQPQSK